MSALISKIEDIPQFDIDKVEKEFKRIMNSPIYHADWERRELRSKLNILQNNQLSLTAKIITYNLLPLLVVNIMKNLQSIIESADYPDSFEDNCPVCKDSADIPELIKEFDFRNGSHDSGWKEWTKLVKCGICKLEYTKEVNKNI